MLGAFGKRELLPYSRVSAYPKEFNAYRWRWRYAPRFFHIEQFGRFVPVGISSCRSLPGSIPGTVGF